MRPGDVARELHGSFAWGQTSQGHGYWTEVWRNLIELEAKLKGITFPSMPMEPIKVTSGKTHRCIDCTLVRCSESGSRCLECHDNIRAIYGVKAP